MEIRCLGDGIGAGITGVDVNRMDEAEFGRIYRAWLDYNVICVRGQQLSDYPPEEDRIHWRVSIKEPFRRY